MICVVLKVEKKMSCTSLEFKKLLKASYFQYSYIQEYDKNNKGYDIILNFVIAILNIENICP